MKINCLAIIVATTLTTGTTSVYAEDNNWHLLTQTYGGTINLVKPPLTEKECNYALHRLKGEPATDQEIADKKAKDAADKEAWTKKQEEQKKQQALLDAKWEQWKKDHECPPQVSTYSISGGESYKDSKGMCVKGDEFYTNNYAMITEGSFMHLTQPSDIKLGECFQ